LEAILDSIGYFETRYAPQIPEPTRRLVSVGEFEQFLLELSARHYVPGKDSENLSRTMKDGRRWWSRPAALLTGRLYALERGAKDSKLRMLSMRTASIAEWNDSGKDPFSIDFVGASKRLPAYLPREIGTSVEERKDARALYASWEWKMRLLFNRLPFFVHVTPVQRLFEPEPATLMRVGARYHWESEQELKWGVGLDVNRRWTVNPTSQRRTALGASSFVEWKCIRATAGVRDVGELFWNVTDKFAQGRANNYLDIAFVF
jgi:hypothetical protein